MSRVLCHLKLVEIIVRLATLACLTACELDTGLIPSASNEIVALSLRSAENPQLAQDVSGSISGTGIALNVPNGTDVTALVPTIYHTGESISPASGEPRSFEDPVEYVVTAADGSEREYTVSVLVAAASSKDIRTFRIGTTQATIDGADITVTLAHGTDLTRLRGIVGHSGVSVDPESGAEQDFSKPVVYTVTAKDGSTKAYTVTVTEAPSSARDITSFEIGSHSAQVNGAQITLTLPNGSDLRALEPSVSHTGVSIEPASGSAQDFRGPVTYIVTAADGSSRAYTVLVSVAQSGARDITGFSIEGVDAAISGSAITLTLPFDTDLTYLAPRVEHSGKSVSPQSLAPRDFTQPVTYTVTAGDGSTKQYTVTVSLAPNTAKQIIDFVILGSTGQINDTTITLTLPYGADPAALIPTILHTGAQVSPASGVMQSFTEPRSYVVTAADGSTRTYSVIVTVAASGAKDISQFSLLNVAGAIANGAISLTVPYGSDVSAVAPTLTHTGASIEPASGQTRDFRSPQTYTVTAHDGTTRVYTVNVAIASNSAKAITHFALLGRDAEIDGTNITLTLPYGSVVSSLTPDITHTGASIDPGATVARDFGQPVTYTVTAANSSSAVYSVIVTVAPNHAKTISTFRIMNIPGTVGDGTVTLTVPFGTDLTSLAPTITSTGVSVSPATGVARDFSQPVTYRVRAEDNSTKDYVVTVTAALSGAKEITTFTILGKPGSRENNAITVTLPYGTSRSGLVPTITTTGKHVSPASDVPQDFTQAVSYRVTAQDDTFQDFTVSVIIAPNDAKDITGFSILGTPAQLGTDTVTLTLPFGTSRTALTPQISISGDSVEPPSNVLQDFTAAQVYTVKASDGSEKAYTVTVTVASAAVDCRALLASLPATSDGVYSIDPDGAAGLAPFSVYCDMTSHGGGWTLLGKTAAGDYTALGAAAFVDLIVNPSADVNESLLQTPAAPSAGQIAFYSKAKTNALYHAGGALRAVRVDMSGHLLVPAANGTYFQQRVSAPSDWDFWLALRDARQWNADGSADLAPNQDSVAHFGTDFVLSNVAGDFDPTSNVVTHRGDGSYSFVGTYTHTLPDLSTVTVSRHLGLLNDGVDGLSSLWLLTAVPNDSGWLNDSTTQQSSVIWLR